jgi:hypothetical protein
MSGCVVYHYTCLHSLPAIVASGVLLPSIFDTELASGEPLLWATVDPNGDRTARPFVDDERWEALCAGASKLVRITLSSRGFISWKTLRRRRLRQAEADGFDDIVLDGIQFAFEGYELSAAWLGQLGVENTWRVRQDPNSEGLPIRRALDIATKSITGNRWRSIPKSDRLLGSLTLTGVVYHFTDTLRLPWILAGGELQPSVTDLFPDVTPLRYL